MGTQATPTPTAEAAGLVLIKYHTFFVHGGGRGMVIVGEEKEEEEERRRRW